LRIISGSARGRRLFSPPGQGLSIRPTSDRARESLFNIIGSHVEQAAVLDLFAGTGALGLEACSRGAGSVTFVDNNRLALELIRKNIETCFPSAATLSAVPRLTIIQHDLRRGLPLHLLQKKQLFPFDLVFLDPPYSQGLCQRVLQDWDNHNLLTTGGLLVAEERAKEKLTLSFSTLELVDNRVYGETAFWIFAQTNR
jgi:16S rRNA (guanine966-N2)-methyltransferase